MYEGMNDIMGNRYFTVGEEMTGKLVYDIEGNFTVMCNELISKYSNLTFHDIMMIYDVFIRVCFVKDSINSNKEIDIMIGSNYEACLNEYAEENFVDIISKYFQAYKNISSINHIYHQDWYFTKDYVREYDEFKKQCLDIWNAFKQFTIELLGYIQSRKKLVTTNAVVEEFVFSCESGRQMSFSRVNDEDWGFIFIKSHSFSSYESDGTRVIRDSMTIEQNSSFENCITVSN